MLLAIIQNYDRKYPEAEALLKEALGIKPAGEDEPKLLFILGRTYMKWGRRGRAKMMQQIVRDYPESPMAQKARETLAALDRESRAVVLTGEARRPESGRASVDAGVTARPRATDSLRREGRASSGAPLARHPP